MRKLLLADVDATADTEPAPFTTASIEAAVRVLRENNVPPVACSACGATWYLRPPAGWEPGDPVFWRCECGLEQTVGKGIAARRAGELLGYGAVLCTCGEDDSPQDPGLPHKTWCPKA